MCKLLLIHKCKSKGGGLRRSNPNGTGDNASRRQHSSMTPCTGGDCFSFISFIFKLENDRNDA
jgi:hypothetical protein